VHALPGGVLGAVESRRYLRVRELVDHAQLDRLALAAGHARHRAGQGLAVVGRVREHLDACDGLVVETRHLDPEPPDRAPLDLLAAKPVRELLRRDAVQPRRSRLAHIAEAAAPLVGDGEGLGQQVGGHLGVEDAPVQIGEEWLGAAVVELAERARVGSRGDDELCVGH
jgi:hypothetical protein